MSFSPPKRKYTKRSPSSSKQTPPGVESAIPAIVVPAESAKVRIFAPAVRRFDAALKQIVYEINGRRAPENSLSLRQENEHQWTMVGSMECEYLAFTLDRSYAFFTAASLLPFDFEIQWHFSRAGAKVDIENALAVLYI